MARKRILIPGVSSDAALGMIRQLVECGYEVIGADWQRLPLGLHSRHLRTVHPLPGLTDPGFGKNLVDLVRNARPDAFIPLGTATVAIASREAALLKNYTSFSIPEYDAYLAAFDKTRCSTECRKLGIPCPTAYSPEEAAGALKEGEEGVTLVVKPGTDMGMASGVEYVRHADRLQGIVSSCANRFGSVTIQEYIPGDASHMHTAVLLFDGHSELVAAFTTQKLRQWPTTGGITALSRSTDAYHLVEQVLPFFRKWQWKGAAEVEFKFDPRDGRYKVIEINPRFPAYLRFAMGCGLPLARLSAEISLADGGVAPLKYPSYAVGRKFVNPGLFLRTTLKEMRGSSNRFATLGKAVGSLSGTGQTFRGMLSDPLPVLGRLLLDLRNLRGHYRLRR
ncbi:MAG: ATP-grasp domain-containing protein [Geobacteraceae bacterium]|nr:ATP-grasp domain-containing protein [Geobacteraceae bacterium]